MKVQPVIELATCCDLNLFDVFPHHGLRAVCQNAFHSLIAFCCSFHIFPFDWNDYQWGDRGRLEAEKQLGFTPQVEGVTGRGREGGLWLQGGFFLRSLHCMFRLHGKTKKIENIFWNLVYSVFFGRGLGMNSMKLVILLYFISWKNSFSYISRKCILPNMIRTVLTWILPISNLEANFLGVSRVSNLCGCQIGFNY